MSTAHESAERRKVGYQVRCDSCGRMVDPAQTEESFDRNTGAPGHMCGACVSLAYQAFMLKCGDHRYKGLNKKSPEVVRATLREVWEAMVRDAARTMCPPNCRSGCDFVERSAFAVRDWQVAHPRQVPKVEAIAEKLALNSDHFRRQLRRHTGKSWRDVQRAMAREWDSLRTLLMAAKQAGRS